MTPIEMLYDVHFNMCGGAITPSVIKGALIKTGLHWEMHPAQLFSLEINSLFAEGKEQAVWEKIEEKGDELLCELIPHTKYTLCGLPVVPRADYPEGWIDLVDTKKHTLIHIDNCAVPSVFGDWRDWQVHQANQNAKAEAIWHERQG